MKLHLDTRPAQVVFSQIAHDICRIDLPKDGAKEHRARLQQLKAGYKRRCMVEVLLICHDKLDAIAWGQMPVVALKHAVCHAA